MCKGIFVTGTGTDVGKTYVTGIIVKKLREAGYRSGYYKAALSGAMLIEDRLVPGDCKDVVETAGLVDTPESLVSYIYQTPVSPHLAAKLEGRPVEMEVIQQDFANIKERFDYITVEGSGGIVCPLRLDHETILLEDVILALGLDILIVSDAELGSINRAVLTVAYAKQRGIGVKGILLNGYDESNDLHRDNRQVIEQLTGVPVLACIERGARELKIEISALLAQYQEV